MVNNVEGDAKCGIGLVEARINPAVHHLPEVANLRILLLPGNQHFMGSLDRRSLFLCLLLVHTRVYQLFNLALVPLVKSNVAVAYKMVALDALGLRGLAIKELLPSEHALADMHATVVDDGGLYNLVAAGLEQT